MPKGFKLKYVAARELVRRCERDLGRKISEGMIVDLLLDQELIDDLKKSQLIARLITEEHLDIPIYPAGEYIVRMRDEDGTWFWTGRTSWDMYKQDALRTDHETAAKFAEGFNTTAHDRIVGPDVVIDTRGNT